MQCLKKFALVLGFIGSFALSAQAADFYVATTGSDDNPGTSESPFLTIGKAITAANAAIVAETLSSATISVGVGTYTETGMRLDYPVTVTGDITDPSKVEIVDAVQNSRAFTITNAAARLEGVTISGLGMRNTTRGSSGGHVYMTAGTVADCVITGGRASSNGGGNGGNVAISGGALLRSKITLGMASTHNGDQGNVGSFRGGNVYASGTALVANCVIAEGNSNWVRDGNPVCSGIALQGSAKVVNSTIVKNIAKSYPSKVGAYGVYCESESARVLNCVIYGNGNDNTSLRQFNNTNPSCFINCAFAAGAAGSTVSPVTGVTTFDFDDYANGDYHYPNNSILINVGDNELYPTEAGSVDLDGEARVSDTIIDIGCYERDLTSAIVYGSVDAYSVVGGDSMTFTANAKGGAGTYKYKWNFGDGSAEQVTSETSVTHSFGCGLYQVSVAVSEDDGATWSEYVPLLEKIRAYPTKIFVDPTKSSTATYPYATAATAAHSLWDAIYSLTNDISGSTKPVKSVSTTIQILDGTLAATDKGFTISAPITIRGNAADRSKVTVGPASSTNGRIFTLSAAGATLADLTIRNGQNAYGGNVNMVAGTMVTNCVVTGGKSVSSNNADFGGNIYMTGGTVSGCEVKDGNCSANNNYSAGLGIHATGGLIENCYIHGNYGKTNGNKTGGVELRGAAYIVNCTVVDNYRNGDKGTIAQVHVNDTSARVVNCVLFNTVDKASTTTFDGDNGACFYGCAAQSTITSGKNCIVIDKSAFCGAIAGDYHIPATSPLFDGGDAATLKYATYAKSTVDYEGNPRISPSAGTIDIGCFEFDQSSPTADGTPAKYSGVTGTEKIRFTAIAIGASGESVRFKWNFDDGDEPAVTTSSTTYDYAFVNSGVHAVSVSLSTDSGSTWSTPRVLAEKVVTHPATMYVDPTKASTPTFPYATKETAAWTIKDALNCLTNNYSLGSQVLTVVAEIRIMDGDISGTNLKLDAAVTFTSDSQDASKASIAGTSSARVFYLNHASAKVTHLTVKNGGFTSSENSGGNIFINRGTVEDCIVKDGGGATASAKGGNIYLVNGRVSRCVISGGKCTYSGSGSGGNIHIAGAGTVENCLISGGQLNKNGNGQVYLNHASARVVNCTIVKGTGINTSVAFGVYVNDASAKVVDCVIYDNGGTAAREWGNANGSCFVNCAFASGLAPSAGTACIDTVTDAAFRDYANKDYRQAKGECVLKKAGVTKTEYTTYATSATDLEGNEWGKILDIGCYAAPTVGGLLLIIR